MDVMSPTSFLGYGRGTADSHSPEESCSPSILQSGGKINSHHCLLVSVPAKVVELKENSSASSGEQTVTCSAEGMPQPEISWSTCSDIKW